MEQRNTCAVVTFNDGSKRHYTNVLRGSLSMSRRGARIALTMLDHSIQYLEGSNSVMMVDRYWLETHQDLITESDPVEVARKPTPGPWWVDGTGAIASGDPDHYYVIAETCHSRVPEPQRAANAELLSHALQMRELLSQLVECSHNSKITCDGPSSRVLQESETLLAHLNAQC